MPPGTELMAEPKKKPKGRPKAKAKEPVTPPPSARLTIINLKGTQEQADWLDDAHRKTHYTKSVIVRLALDLWAKERGLPPFPVAGDDE